MPLEFFFVAPWPSLQWRGNFHNNTNGHMKKKRTGERKSIIYSPLVSLLLIFFCFWCRSLLKSIVVDTFMCLAILSPTKLISRMRQKAKTEKIESIMQCFGGACDADTIWQSKISSSFALQRFTRNKFLVVNKTIYHVNFKCLIFKITFPVFRFSNFLIFLHPKLNLKS